MAHDTVGTKTDDEIVTEAKERFKIAMEWEGDFRRLFTEDLKFVRADPDNGFQWPEDMRDQRTKDQRPSLTINKTRQHALMVINEAKESKPAMRIRAVGGEASYDSAQIYEGLARHIEYQSNAADVYDTALQFQVWTGIGYWRVVTDYIDDSSFDQDAFIRRIRNPLSVLLDPSSKEEDASDAQWGFVFDDMTRKEFERKYPKFKDKVRADALSSTDGWCSKDSIRVAEYYYIDYTADQLLAVPMPVQDANGAIIGMAIETMLLSTLRETNPELAKAVLADDSVQRRPVQRPQVKWCMIAGDQVVDRSLWVGATVPIVKVVGEECIIDGRLDRKGHVRNLKDPQRMYNYWSSSAVEFVALQGKAPWVVDTTSIEGVEAYWENANTENSAYLPYNSVDQNGNALAPPRRAEPPQMGQAYLVGMQASAEEMKMVSGQNDPLMGAPSNEISGVAIGKRAKQADRSTMHFRDNLAKAIRRTGKILIDIIPKIYDTERVVRILAEDGSDDTVSIDPSMAGAMRETPKDPSRPDEGMDRIFNPNVGKYEVVADSGPSYASRREEAFDAMTQLAALNPQFLAIAGDLFMRAADFPMADELAERFANSIPSAIKGDGPSPEVVELQQQVEQSQAIVQQLQQQLAMALQAAADESAKNDDKSKNTEINAYKAMTDRLNTLMDKLDPLQAQLVAMQSVSAALADPQPIDQAPTAAPVQPQALPPELMQTQQPPMI